MCALCVCLKLVFPIKDYESNLQDQQEMILYIANILYIQSENIHNYATDKLNVEGFILHAHT